MKRIIVLMSLLFVVMTINAIPARKGMWKTLTLNGKTVTAQLMGDEHMHYWQTDDGQCLSEVDGTFVPADMSRLRAKAMSRRTKVAASRQMRQHRNTIGDFAHHTGEKKGIVILVEFSNMSFQNSNDSLLYTRVLNEPGFSKGQFRGSVSDYFREQSYGLFNLNFDVVGPVVMPNTYQYYGKDEGGEGNDVRPGEMVAEVCMAVDDYVDFRNYDWDGDGIVDQVLCVYAGKGQADGGNSSTIWPHEWELSDSDYGQTLMLDSVIINTYAVTNERGYSGIEGIGIICHEFAHCLGLPDMYDTTGYNFGMGTWSPMDGGSYNGNSFCPAGFTSFEKYTCGWVEPVVLDNDTIIDDMQPLSDSPVAYMIRNDAYPDEYYLVENRQQHGWDTELPGKGMLVLHVDFDRDIWENNLVNSNNTDTSDGLPLNNHQRCTIFHANNKGKDFYVSSSGDAYPYQKNDSLTANSKPVANLYHEGPDGTKRMRKSLLDIKRQTDGAMSFRFRNDNRQQTGIAESKTDAERCAYYTLTGRFVGTSKDGLTPGIYIRRNDVTRQSGKTIIR